MVVFTCRDYNTDKEFDKEFSCTNEARNFLIKCCHSSHLRVLLFTYTCSEEYTELIYWFNRQGSTTLIRRTK